MIRALRTAATGMAAQELLVDTISNNLANINTTGFKKSNVEFQDLIYQNQRAIGAENVQGVNRPTEIQIGHGTMPVSIQKMFSQGDINATNSPLDLAVDGDGFFQIIRNDGSIAFSRDGSFKLSADGRVVTAEGLLLDPEVSIPADATEIQISQDGVISVVTGTDVMPTEIGRIELSRFINPAGLKNLGGNLYQQTAASGEPIIATPGTEQLGTIRQGFLEMSNVMVVEEMVNLIVAQRAYEINSKTIRTTEEMLTTATNLRR